MGKVGLKRFQSIIFVFSKVENNYCLFLRKIFFLPRKVYPPLKNILPSKQLKIKIALN